MWFGPRQLLTWDIASDTSPSCSIITHANAIRRVVRFDQVAKSVPDCTCVSIVLVGSAYRRPCCSVRRFQKGLDGCGIRVCSNYECGPSFIRDDGLHLAVRPNGSSDPGNSVLADRDFGCCVIIDRRHEIGIDPSDRSAAYHGGCERPGKSITTIDDLVG